MNLPLFWIDAFANRIFAGNPAAVVPLDQWPEDRLLAAIAAENGLSETAFFVRRSPTSAHLRWFTPAVEVDLCGHATLAAAWVLFHELGAPGDALEFQSRSGPLIVRRSADRLELDFPAAPAHPCESDPGLASALGAAPRIFMKNARSWLCVYESAAEVAALRPDPAALGSVRPGRIIVTAPGTGCDFVSRFFAPDAGIAEDPVTGSAHCTLVPYWSARLGRKALHARQVSARGGELWCVDGGERIRIAGCAVLYLRGSLEIDPSFAAVTSPS